MKKFLTTAILLAMFTTWSVMMAQPHQEEYLGLPGDNLNLYAVMKLFQESQTLESFERNLNDENTRINNLDLNGDNVIDYIRVTDYVDRDVHNIVLQIPVNNRENQDVAVFTVQRFRNGQVQIQLIGDEALYGRNYIIEPIYDGQYANQTPNPGYSGNVTAVGTSYYNIAAWPVVRFIFMPSYIAWNSLWYWGYYPSYWHPWQPYYWHFYYGYHYNWYDNYYSHYHRCDYTRYAHWNDFYYSNRRSHSPYVSERIHSGHYQTTYSHPDQRRKGEALYASTNHEQINRRAVQNPANSTARRESSGTDQNRHSTATSFSTSRRNNTSEARSAANPVTARNTATARRSATTGKESFATTRTKETNTNTARKSSVSVNNRTAAPASATHNSGTARKSATNVSTRSASAQPNAYNSSSERKSASTVSSRPASNSRPAQSTAQSRSTSRPVKSGESFSSRRSSGQSQSVKTSKSSDNKKSTETTKNTKRR